MYGVPSRLRGDHGTENILVAAWMEERCGERRGSYIWGRYLHSPAKTLSQTNFLSWAGVSITSALNACGLMSLLKLALLGVICSQCLSSTMGLISTTATTFGFFISSFSPQSTHLCNFLQNPGMSIKFRLEGGPNRSPSDMFYFDMLVHGVRGELLTDMCEGSTREPNLK